MAVLGPGGVYFAYLTGTDKVSSFHMSRVVTILEVHTQFHPILITGGYHLFTVDLGQSHRLFAEYVLVSLRRLDAVLGM